MKTRVRYLKPGSVYRRKNGGPRRVVEVLRRRGIWCLWTYEYQVVDGDSVAWHRQPVLPVEKMHYNAQVETD